LKGGRIAEEFQQLVEDYVRSTFGEGGRRTRDGVQQGKTFPIKAAL
jgi:hypothetical protein